MIIFLKFFFSSFFLYSFTYLHITFCAIDQETTSGWKLDIFSEYEYENYDLENLNELDLSSDILTQCNDSNSVEEVYECEDGKTFNLTETVHEPTL